MVAWRMAARLLGLISTLVLARILTPADFGLVALATTFINGVEALSVMGLDDALVRDKETTRALNDTAFTLTAARGITNAAIVAGLAYPASIWFAEPRVLPILFVLAILTVMAGVENIGIVSYRRSLQFDKEFLLFFPPRVFGVLTTISLALQFHSYWALVGGILATRLLRLAMTYLLHPYRPRLSLQSWRHLLSFSCWTWATGLAAFCWDRSEVFILGHTMGTTQVGLLLIATEIAVLPISELVGPAARALFSGFSAAQRRGKDLEETSIGVTAMLMIVVAPLAITLSAAAGDVTRVLLGSQWVGGELLIAMFAPLAFPAVFTQVISAALVAQARVRERFFIVAFSAGAKMPIVYFVASMGNLRDVAVIMIAASIFESWLFIHRLKSWALQPVRVVTPDMVRIIVAVSVTVGVLYTTGIGWRSGAASIPEALLHGVGVGSLTAAVFVGVQCALWLMAGRPDGGEMRLFQVFQDLVPRLKTRPSIG
jgi:O-antigen/teichoic acid export membrane protein